MPRPPTPQYWRKRVLAELAANGRASATAILRSLEAHAEELRKLPEPGMRALAEAVPSVRTIGRIKEKDWLPMPGPARAQYRAFSWPESMERGDLPWEASAAGLELLRACLRRPDLTPPFRQGPFNLRGLLQSMRPTIDEVRWFWRVTQAMPGPPQDTTPALHLEFRRELALILHARGIFKDDKDRGEDTTRDVEEALIWERTSDEDMKVLMERLRNRMNSLLDRLVSSRTEKEPETREGEGDEQTRER